MLACKKPSLQAWVGLRCWALSCFAQDGDLFHSSMDGAISDCAHCLMEQLVQAASFMWRVDGNEDDAPSRVLFHPACWRGRAELQSLSKTCV
jgi:hypothetical protein